MGKLAYSVLATFPDEPTAREYSDWLAAGHIQAVLRAGAVHAEVFRSMPPSSLIQVEVRYLFPNQAAFDRYVAEDAPALRAEGLARFPPERGIRLDRRTALCLHEFPGK
ncbi:MAG: DUF4286 family protein [Planctomycetes bacterium]|nr:DUF4286 family protein [Planctomycetota bacterium]